MGWFKRLPLYTLILLGLEIPIQGRILVTHVVQQTNCENIEQLKNVKVECELLKFQFISKFQIGDSTVPFLLDTGSELSWVLTKETNYLLVKKVDNNLTAIKDYDKDWTQYFSSSPLNVTLPDITTDDQLGQITYDDGSLIVDYQIDHNPIELQYEDWTVNLNMRFATYVMQQTRHKNHYSGILGLKYDPHLELMASLLYQSHSQHKETSDPMISIDINLKGGVPTSPSYFGFGQSIRTMPIGFERKKVVSVTSDTMDWLIKIKYIKTVFQLEFENNQYCFNDEHYALLDTGAGMVYLPEELKMDVPAKTRNYTFGVESFPSGWWTQHLPNIKLGIGDSEIIIPALYLYYVSDGNMWKSTLRSMAPVQASPSRVYHTILGVAFFSVVYTEFHYSPAPDLGFPNVGATIEMLSKIQ